jgi:hypothetical protein
MVLTSSPIRALCLREVNLFTGRIGEEKTDECIAEEGGDFGNSFVERGITIAHERSPSETTHDDLRLAVEPASGGCSWRGVLPRSSTIYAAQVRIVRDESRALTTTGL